MFNKITGYLKESRYKSYNWGPFKIFMHKRPDGWRAKLTMGTGKRYDDITIGVFVGRATDKNVQEWFLNQIATDGKIQRAILRECFDRPILRTSV